MTGPEPRLILEALIVPIVISAGFKVAGVPQMQRMLRRWAETAREPATAGIVNKTVRAVFVVRRRTGVGGTCLVRSLTLWALLLKRGVNTEIRIGMRSCGGRIEGHAWVEHEGLPLGEDMAVVESYEAYREPIRFENHGQGHGP